MLDEMVNIKVNSTFLHFSLEDRLARVTALLEHSHRSNIRGQYRSVKLSKLPSGEPEACHLTQCCCRDALAPVFFCHPVADFTQVVTPSGLRVDTDTAHKAPLMFDHSSNGAILL
jgi:hypothetical protein